MFLLLVSFALLLLLFTLLHPQDLHLIHILLLILPSPSLLYVSQVPSPPFLLISLPIHDLEILPHGFRVSDPGMLGLVPRVKFIIVPLIVPAVRSPERTLVGTV
jgi:hypothetical protein